MKKHHEVENVKIEKGVLIMTVDGNTIHRNLKDISSSLSSANNEEQNTFEVSPSGYGISWPLIDEDLSIDGLLGIEHQPNTNRKSA